jgi:hypothetical protein
MAAAASARVTRGRARTDAMPTPVRIKVNQCFAAECIHPLLGAWCKQRQANEVAVAASRFAIAAPAIYCKHYPECRNSYHPGVHLVFVLPTAVVAG